MYFQQSALYNFYFLVPEELVEFRIRGLNQRHISVVERLFRRLCREAWPLDGMKFDTLKEMHAKRLPENLEIDEGECPQLNFILQKL